MGAFTPGPDHSGRISEQVQSLVTFSVESPETLRAQHLTNDGHTIALQASITANQSITGFKLTSNEIIATASKTNRGSFSGEANVEIQFADGSVTGIDRFPVTISVSNIQPLDLSHAECEFGPGRDNQLAQVA
jgi:hypothetical protein